MGDSDCPRMRAQGRVCVLSTWLASLSAITLHALWSYAASRAPVRAGERRLLSRTSAEGARSVVQHRSASVLDGRLLVRGPGLAFKYGLGRAQRGAAPEHWVDGRLLVRGCG